MWHEARKQEKKIRGLMVDFKKRAERRREFYEKTKLDPTQFLRVYGRPYKIHLDPAIAMAAESPQSMMPWQGNRDNLIDRFDVRAHLDFMPEYDPQKNAPLKVDEDEERHLNYERYRTLVENEAAGLTEEQALQQIYIDEQFGPPDKTAEDEKKKLAGKKAAIGYTYEDSTPVTKEEDEESEESSDTDIEAADLDITLNVDELTPDQIIAINQCAEIYGMKQDDFVRLLSKDKEELEALRQAKIIEEEKAQFAGRKSRRERRAFKEKRLAGRKISPPSYAARDSPKYEPYKKDSSSSRSRSPSPAPANIGKKLFITSFGKESDNDEACLVHGPSLPSESGPRSEQSRLKRRSWSPQSKRHSGSHRSSVRDRPRSPTQSSSRHCRDRRNRHSARSRSRSQSRSRSRGFVARNRRDYGQYSRSRSPRRRINYDRRNQYRRYTRSRSRSRSNMQRRSRSRSGSKASSRSSLKSRSRSRSISSPSSSYSSSSSRSPSSRSRSKSRSPTNVLGQVPVKRYRRPSVGSNSSKSDSDMETNGNQNYNETKSSPAKRSAKPISLPGNLAQSNKNRLTPQERLKRRMQAQLNRQHKADKKAEVHRTLKVEQERMDREEELRTRALEMRRREREKRHRELEEEEHVERRPYRGPSPKPSTNMYDSSSSSSHVEEPVPQRTRRWRTYSRSRSRSGSESRSRSREKQKLVAY